VSDSSLTYFVSPNYPYAGSPSAMGASAEGLNQLGQQAGNLIDWAKLPPGLGFADTVTYQHGLPQRDNHAGLLANWARLGALTPLYLTLAQVAPPWAIPVWTGVLALNEARRSQDGLSQGQNMLQAAVPVLAGSYAGVPLGRMLAFALEDKENQALYELLQTAEQEPLLEAMISAQKTGLAEKLNQQAAEKKQAIHKRFADWRLREGWSSTTTPEPAHVARQLNRELAGVDKWRSSQNRQLRLAQAKLDEIKPTWQRFVRTFEQSELYQLPYKRKRLAFLQGEVFRYSDRLPHQQVQQLDAVLRQALDLLPQQSHWLRDPKELLNGPAAAKLKTDLLQLNRDLLKHRRSTLPNELFEPLQQELAWLEAQLQSPHSSGLPRPTAPARAWFNFKQIKQRFEGMQQAKAELNNALAGLDRSTIEAAFARREPAMMTRFNQRALRYLKGLEPQEFQRQVTNFFTLKSTLHNSQELFPKLLKHAGPALGFLTVGSVLAYPVLYTLNKALARMFPQASQRLAPNPFAPYKTQAAGAAANPYYLPPLQVSPTTSNPTFQQALHYYQDPLSGYSANATAASPSASPGPGMGWHNFVLGPAFHNPEPLPYHPVP
jgi:hypothetical protein